MTATTSASQWAVLKLSPLPTSTSTHVTCLLQVRRPATSEEAHVKDALVALELDCPTQAADRHCRAEIAHQHQGDVRLHSVLRRPFVTVDPKLPFLMGCSRRLTFWSGSGS